MQRELIEIDNISTHLYCVICEEVFLDPRRLGCGHTFCNDCIKLWKNKQSTCPICRKKFSEARISKDLIVSKMIEDLKVMCKNKYCIWTGNPRQLTQHLKECRIEETLGEEMIKQTFTRFQHKSTICKVGFNYVKCSCGKCKNPNKENLKNEFESSVNSDTYVASFEQKNFKENQRAFDPTRKNLKEDLFYTNLDPSKIPNKHTNFEQFQNKNEKEKV